MPSQQLPPGINNWFDLAEELYGNARFAFQLMAANPGIQTLQPGMNFNAPNFDTSVEPIVSFGEVALAAEATTRFTDRFDTQIASLADTIAGMERISDQEKANLIGFLGNLPGIDVSGAGVAAPARPPGSTKFGGQGGAGRFGGRAAAAGQSAAGQAAAAARLAAQGEAIPSTFDPRGEGGTARAGGAADPRGEGAAPRAGVPSPPPPALAPGEAQGFERGFVPSAPSGTSFEGIDFGSLPGFNFVPGVGPVPTGSPMFSPPSAFPPLDPSTRTGVDPVSQLPAEERAAVEAISAIAEASEDITLSEDVALDAMNELTASGASTEQAVAQMEIIIASLDAGVLPPILPASIVEAEGLTDAQMTARGYGVETNTDGSQLYVLGGGEIQDVQSTPSNGLPPPDPFFRPRFLTPTQAGVAPKQTRARPRKGQTVHTGTLPDRFQWINIGF